MATAYGNILESYDVKEHDILAALYDEDGRLEINVDVTARAIQEDYGVSGSPVWTAYEDVCAETIYVNDVNMTWRAFEIKYGHEIAGYVHDVIDGIEFEWE